ncbi:DUF3311 domain-containing protein [Amycolatopsis jiangsuensis]|uniref:DUF3311 domain-containing protein n=1 Tax=Amycolatopsis jiangsuensis TaxID=1181879 RepID=A0A840ISV7_9PSEU|nr:DUF3311 domain-containing protein [Amycolatopsis jiangsuensis]MBB4684074.1 hypothetical protein [Amycolatopsis jiangsuensis]
MIRSRASVVIGLGVPVVAVVAGILVLAGNPTLVFGIPVVFCWMFCCFPLTTACLWVSWRFFDSRHYRQDGER